MTTTIILSNIIALIASILMVIGGLFKSKKTCLIVQSIQLLITIIVSCMLGAISAIIVNGISIFRNILTYKNKLNSVIKIVMNIIVFTLTIIFAKNIVDLFPFIAFFIYTIILDKLNDIQFKWLNNIVMILWTIYDFSFQAYIFFIFDILFIVTNNIALFKLYKENNYNKRHDT